MPDPHPKQDVALAQQAVDHLMEHFESVQIFATRLNEAGESVTVNLGAGNYYARVGMIDMWLMSEKHAEAHRRMPQVDL